MKNFKIKSLLFSLLAVLMITITMTSCEKTGTINDSTDIQEEFLNTTGNSGKIEIDVANAQKPLFHKSFNGNLSREETEIKWNKIVKEYLEANPIKNTGVEDRSSNFWDVVIRTRTGNNGTDADVYARIFYRTNQGDIIEGWTDFELNNFGDDRETGDIDYYYFRHYSNSPISWVELNNAQLALKGTDAWDVEWYDIYSDSQDFNSTGFYRLYTDPNITLYNSNSQMWDYYDTNSGEIISSGGRLNF